MNRKRTTLKGKGADFFLEEAREAPKQDKATFYLPPSLITCLDEVWLDLRRRNRRLKKSDIVRVALEQIFRDYEERRQDSVLSQRFTSAPSPHYNGTPSKA